MWRGPQGLRSWAWQPLGKSFTLQEAHISPQRFELGCRCLRASVRAPWLRLRMVSPCFPFVPLCNQGLDWSFWVSGGLRT